MDEAPAKAVPVVSKVKNKAPAAIQITAEQLLREAKERELEVIPAPPKQKISDSAELQEYQLRKRKEFEDNVRKNRSNVSHWLKYAKWEESQYCVDRARSIFERALDTFGSRNITVWLKYIEMEMTNRQVKHARTLFDRATYILPRVNQFWYKYVYFEESLGNFPACRNVFERWVKFLPGEQEWQTYINFEMRYKEVDLAREIYSKYVMLHPETKTWIKFARFEERYGTPENARQIYELAIEFFEQSSVEESLYIAFAHFEERQNEYDRVKLIYDYAIEKMPKEKAPTLFENYATFQKKHGHQKDIESLISKKCKLVYEDRLKECPHDYDTWYDYIKLAEEEFDLKLIREIYERAVACVPKDCNKEAWRRYIYLWIYYATFEEIDAKNPGRAMEVYDFCLNNLIPHERFTFAKVWIAAAKLKLRNGQITKCREILDRSLELCPKRKLFKEYIEIEIQLREFNNCRKLYKDFLQRAPEDSSVWINYAELEAIIMQVPRARAIYRAAINRPDIESAELVWKAFIDFEIEQLKSNLEIAFNNIKNFIETDCDDIEKEYSKVEQLYEELLEKTNHVKVWLNYAQVYVGLIDFYENLVSTDNELIDNPRWIEKLGKLVGSLHIKARNVFDRANERLADDETASRRALLECWKDFEDSIPNGLDMTDKMPTQVRKRRRDGDDLEEVVEWVFPEAKKRKIGLMNRVKKWKNAQSESMLS